MQKAAKNPSCAMPEKRIYPKLSEPVRNVIQNVLHRHHWGISFVNDSL